MYAKVENGQVVSVGALPVNYANVSGFNGLDNAALKEYGFLPFSMVMPEFNDKTHKYNNPEYVIGEDAVTLTYEAIPLSEEELAEIEANKWISIRRERNTLLSDTDWTMLDDAPISEETKAEYVTYRQALRNLPQTFANADDVVYPTKVA